MKAEQIIDALETRRPIALPPGKISACQIQEDVFQLQSDGHNFFVKWISNQNHIGQNELLLGNVLAQREEIPTPRLLFQQPMAGGMIAGWEWINGHDLRTRSRGKLSSAFARLGKFHLALRNNREVSAWLGGRLYANIHEMLAAEFYRLTMPFDASVRAHCRALIPHLEVGYATLMHGDMHPGNILVEDRVPGQTWIVDWGLACNSLNLFDLDYIISDEWYSTVVLGSELAWTQICLPEANEVLQAYFQAAGLVDVHILHTHQAVMVWSLLRTYENGIRNGYLTEAEQTRHHLLRLLFQT